MNWQVKTSARPRAAGRGPRRRHVPQARRLGGQQDLTEPILSTEPPDKLWEILGEVHMECGKDKAMTVIDGDTLGGRFVESMDVE